MGYLDARFKALLSGDQPMKKKMKAKFDLLNKEDIDALINYYGSFK